MESDPRGLALIINNENFDHLGRRDGTDIDCQALEDMLENLLGFAVTKKVDLSGRVSENIV